MAAMGKAARVRPQAGPCYRERTCYDERGQGQFALLADGRRKRDHFLVSSFDAVFSGVLFFMPSFELMPCDFLIVGAQPASVRSSCLVCLLSKRLLVVRARAEFRNRARPGLAPTP